MSNTNRPFEQFKKIAQMVYQLNLYTVLIWLSFTVLLCPFWGFHIHDVADKILQKFNFLSQRGLFPSPSLQYFSNIDSSIVWGVGSLHGFFFMNLPLAMVLAFQETCCHFIEKRKNKLIFRTLFLLLFFSIFLKLFISFNSFGLVFFYACFIMIVIPPTIHYISQFIHFNAKISFNIKRSFVCFLLILISLSPWFIHPVWDIFLNPNRYDKINKITLVRDWLLLDKNGVNLINTWYYKFSPYAAEAERITIFQPPVIGIYKVKLPEWKRKFETHFTSQKKGNPGQRLSFLNFSDIKDAEKCLSNGSIDYLAINAQNYSETNHLFNKKDSIGYGYYSVEDKNINNGYHFNNYFGVKQNWGRVRVASTPITRQVNHLRILGYNKERNHLIHFFKLFLKKTISNANILYLVILPLAFSFVFFIFICANLFFQFIPWLGLLIFALMTLPSYTMLKHNYTFWENKNSLSNTKKTLEEQIFNLHKIAVTPSKKNITHITQQPLSHDFRLAMWQVNILGNAFRSMPSQQTILTNWLLQYKNQYSNWPINMRYKYIEACSKITMLHPHVNNLLKKETHLYIRWYAENHGFGTDSFSGI